MYDFYRNKVVVVTGGAGFIGSHLVDALVNAGSRVVVVDSFLTGNRNNLAQLDTTNSFVSGKVCLIEADVSRPVSEYLPPEIIPDVFFHLASPASPPRYQAHPIQTYLVNSLGTHQLLQFLLEKNKAARFIFASTSEVYGDPLEHPQTEKYWGNVNPNGVRSCYDEAKRMGETICGVHSRDFGLDIRIARIFNTYGPKMDPEDGRVMPNLIMQSLAQQALTIYGDGTQTRSYCYVSDMVEGLLLLGAVAEALGETINLGNPDEFLILETAQIVFDTVQELAGEQRLAQAEPDLKFEPLPKDDPMRRRPDISKAKAILGWEPKVVLRDGLRETVEFFRGIS